MVCVKDNPPPPPPGPVYLSNKMQLGGCSKLHRNISPLTSDVTDSCKAVVITWTLLFFIRATQSSAEMCHVVISSCYPKTKSDSKVIKIDKPLLSSTEMYKATAWKFNFVFKTKKCKIRKKIQNMVVVRRNIKFCEQWNFNRKLYPDKLHSTLRSMKLFFRIAGQFLPLPDFLFPNPQSPSVLIGFLWKSDLSSYSVHYIHYKLRLSARKLDNPSNCL